MAVPEPQHNRVAMAALFVVFIVATMLVSIAFTDRSDRRDRTYDGPGSEEVAVADNVTCTQPVAVQAPKPDFAAVVAAHDPGTCFLLEPGTYRFHDVVPKDGMIFVGESTEAVVLDGNGFENAFHGTADGVTIAQLTLHGFNDSGGTSRQEQAPIRGTAALWASDRGSMATNWLVTDIVSSGNYASGIFLGEHWTVRNSVFHSNGVTGIGGDHLIGGLIESNIIHGNGAQQAQGALVNGGGLKITQAGTPEAPVVVRNNEFYDNPNIAIWCDIGCDGFHVLDNYVHDQVSRGVMYELSSNLVVRGNTFLRSNTWTNFQQDFNAGAVTVGESRDALIENNVIDDARAGVVVRQTSRPAAGEGFLSGYPYVNYVASNVTVRNNVIRNTQHMGVSIGSSGGGQITEPESILFAGNSYDAVAGMSFWLSDGQQLSYADWQAAGHDVSADGSQASSPESETRGPVEGASIETTTTTVPAQPTSGASTAETTEAPSATEPPQAAPAVTEPPVAEPSVTEPAADEPPTTKPPTSEPQAAEVPATQPSTTVQVATEPSTIEPAATEPSTSTTSYTTATEADPGQAQPADAGRAGPQSALRADGSEDASSPLPTPLRSPRGGATSRADGVRAVDGTNGAPDAASDQDGQSTSATLRGPAGGPSSAFIGDEDGLETLGLPQPAPGAQGSDRGPSKAFEVVLAVGVAMGLGAFALGFTGRGRAVRLPTRRR